MPRSSGSLRRDLIPWLAQRSSPFMASTVAALYGVHIRTARRMLASMAEDGVIVDVGETEARAIVYESAIAWRHSLEVAA